MRLDKYNPDDNTVHLTIMGVTLSRDLETFISSGQVNLLPLSDQATLHDQLKGHPRVVVDNGVGGSYSFSLPSQYNMLLLISGFYLALMMFVPVVLANHFHLSVMGERLEFSVATLFLAVTFPLLNAIGELYGQRKAKQVRNFTVLILLVIAGFYWFQLHVLSSWVAMNHGEAGHDHSLEALTALYHEFPKNYGALAVTIWVADSVSIWVFHSLFTSAIRSISRFHKVSATGWQWFMVRSLIATTLAQLVFMPVGGMLLKGAFWQDAHFFALMQDTALLKLVLVPLCLPVAVVLVYGTRHWRSWYGEGGNNECH